MTRHWVLMTLVAALATQLACGRYGPPVRPAQRPPAVTTPAAPSSQPAEPADEESADEAEEAGDQDA